MRFHVDDPELVPYYQANGFCVVEGIWADAACDDLVAQAYNFPDRLPSDYRPLMQPQLVAPEFLASIRKPRSTHLVETLFGGPASGLQIEFFFGAPATRGYARHQDNFYVEAAPQTFLSIWTALTDIDGEMGGLFVYPGSHRFGKLPVRELRDGVGPNQDPNARNEETVLPAAFRAEPVALTVPKGHAVVLHGDLVHGSLTNESARFRHALLCTYVRKGGQFRPGRSARRHEIDLHVDA